MVLRNKDAAGPEFTKMVEELHKRVDERVFDNTCPEANNEAGACTCMC